MQHGGLARPGRARDAGQLARPHGQAHPGYDLLRQEGLLRLGRKSGAVVRRDACSGPPDPAWARDWTSRLRTLLAEAAAQGMPAEDIVGECEAALADFAFPAAGTEAWNEGGGSP
jgi:GntR family transcriptional regulator